MQLKDMVLAATLGLYFAPGTERFYCVIAGHVYGSGQASTAVADHQAGPTRAHAAEREISGRLICRKSLRGGGAAYSSFETALADEDISLLYTTLALGMKGIAALQPTKYQMLLRAPRLEPPLSGHLPEEPPACLRPRRPAARNTEHLAKRVRPPSLRPDSTPAA